MVSVIVHDRIIRLIELESDIRVQVRRRFLSFIITKLGIVPLSPVFALVTCREAFWDNAKKVESTLDL